MTIETAQYDGQTEAADFYLGMPANNPEFLGTVHEGGPDTLDFWGTFQSLSTDIEYTAQTFRAVVTSMLDTPYWQHSHDSSTDTPWAYCWWAGTLYVYRFGVEMAQVRSNLCKWQPERTVDGGKVTMDHSVRVFRPRPEQRFPSMLEGARRP